MEKMVKVVYTSTYIYEFAMLVNGWRQNQIVWRHIWKDAAF